MLAAGQGASEFATIKRMRNERLLRLVGSVDRQLVDTYHDKIRETVLDELDLADQERLHLKIGEAIEQQEDICGEMLLAALESGDASWLAGHQPVARVYDLAYHFDSARMAKTALAYALIAAEQAKAQFALDVAIENHLIAQKYEEHTSDRIRFRLAFGFGETLVLAGQFSQANEMLVKASELAESNLEIAEVEAVQGEIAYKSGSITESIRLFERAMRRLGMSVPKTRFGLFVSIVGMALSRSLRLSVLTRRLSRSPRSPRIQTLRFRLIFWSNFPYHFSSTLHHIWSGRRILYEAEVDGSPFRIASAQYICGGVLASNIGWQSSQDYFGNALGIATQLNNVGLRAGTLRLRAYARLAVGKFEDAAEDLLLTVEMFQSEVPDFWQRVLSRLWLAAAYVRMGRHTESAEIAAEVFQSAVSGGQDRLAQMAIDTWSRAAHGDLPVGELTSCVKYAPDDFTTTVQLKLAQCHWLLKQGRTYDATEIAEEAVAIIRHRWVLNLWTVPAYSMLARSLREHASGLERNSSGDAAAFENRALTASRWAVRFARFLRIDYPTALRERSLALAAKGRVGKALKFAMKSCKVANEQRARYEYALSLKVCGELGEQLGLKHSASQLSEARSLLKALAQE